jgi:hypothetical protein
MSERTDDSAHAPAYERTFALHTQRVTVVADDVKGAEVARFVCDALAEAPVPREGEQRDASARIDVPRDMARLPPAADALMQALVQKLVWTYADGLALHTAAVEHRGRALLFPASSGTGKSTLTVHLALNGFGFLTDELSFVPLSPTRHPAPHITTPSHAALVHALPRPAHLKPGSGFLIEEHPALCASPHVLRYEDGALIAPSVLHASDPKTPRPLGAIIFPGYAHDARAELERLSPARAAHALLGALINARNLEGLGIAACAQLTTSVPCYKAHYRTLDEASVLLARVTDEINRKQW